ncbi:uncharacterized protein RCC_03991 [Ramularia collo-cygni]|uniref:Inosine/uridine-preferring nucleoside hydrolase domain-containing protein n=1 Tax=Ramularia collo-cygni TaxID=112498 RepID=A0A2D3UQQ6_9PEZI|nr:uncharacterized protein RCC_03991 [Ramularia collo-cygni]CZT18151.1 uncharacterized protein RCC_03991 [Ramularia collo-cygni]
MFVPTFSSLFALFAYVSAHDTAKPVIIDTDFFSDVDDVGALAIANVLHNCGLCDLQAVMINTPSKYGALAASVVNTYYGNGDVPIGALRPLTNETFSDSYMFTLGEYASKISHNFPHKLQYANDTSTPLDLYTSLLQSAEPNSTTIISIGFLTNLASLLSTPTGHSLISQKVQKLIIMGGRYPSGWEFNFGGSDPSSTITTLSLWPAHIPITYSGGELGEAIFSGQSLHYTAPSTSPIRAAYEWYVGRYATARESWDPITVLYGILGLQGFEKLGIQSPFKYVNEFGYNNITAKNASNAWVFDERVRNQHWLGLADGVGNETVAWILNQFYERDPIVKGCFGFGSGSAGHGRAEL